MKKITPCLWFDGQALEAAKFYTSIIKKKSKILSISRYGDTNSHGPKGSVLAVTFMLLGQEFMALNGGPEYKPTPATSLLIGCETQKEIDTLWAGLISGGGKEVQCGWLEDRYGFSWQVAPAKILRMISDKNQAASDRVMAEVMKMVKLDLKTLEKAYRGK